MITFTIQVKSCLGCPRLLTGRTYGNAGRNGTLVYKCADGAFGETGNRGYSKGLEHAPKDIHEDCPHLKEQNNIIKLGAVLQQLRDRGFTVDEHDKFGYELTKAGRTIYVCKADLIKYPDVVNCLENSL